MGFHTTLLFDYGPSTRCGNLMGRELDSGSNDINSSPKTHYSCSTYTVAPLSCIITGYCQTYM